MTGRHKFDDDQRLAAVRETMSSLDQENQELREQLHEMQQKMEAMPSQQPQQSRQFRQFQRSQQSQQQQLMAESLWGSQSRRTVPDPEVFTNKPGRSYQSWRLEILDAAEEEAEAWTSARSRVV
jgi:cell shape-determining protein MreC